MKKHNFSAGPCILPQEVFQQAAEAVLDFNGIGLSLLEISHRSKDFVPVMEEARAIVKRLLHLNDDYEVLFLQGGASLQFLMAPYNLLSTTGKAAYLNTGKWASNAIIEAKKLGNVDVVASSKDEKYSYIPKNYQVGAEYDYFHCTSNNTIYGTQMKEFPKVDTLVACDMSSDIFSRQLDFSKFDLIYAGAQKNMGPAGTVLVVVKKEILGKTGRDIPSYMDYSLHIDKESMFNTPPVFAVYTSLLTLQHLEKNGGIAAVEKINEQKAQLLYSEIDNNPYFEGYARKEDRSLMNVSFNITDESKKEAFDKAWIDAGINGLNGHRSLGGYRASLYNNLPLESVQLLVEVMQSIK
ncbi:3-phosphoserine/phosphohydroxythreonine transaminase [Elizabethkingia sp. JS20170427COW]|uniref:3-phosphoserine/phosphohydroxythreonine transaminase n=1 Tax=Elizabethkingia sp. JS20170427COW TaxID=2583851 RepID=UPI0011102740|nr:3-phosphoserine/phosphohydroxythreonine transaminase [Elizabethkingia sp. JS20170427COW]QCX52255.1 3-phosphoserine/phosphohydroxythreonine transaminase [Elizabethkingia sp. JS20170427COW]